MFYLEYQLWFSWLLLILMLCLPAFSLLLSLPVLFQVRLEPLCPKRIPLGEELELSIRGSALFPIPMFGCKIRLKRPLTGEQWRFRAKIRENAAHCGLLKIELYRCWVCDYLGLFRFRAKHSDGSILVYPNPIPVKLPDNFEKILSLRWKPKPGGGYAENHELRLYRPGDSMNQVHWKLSAKTGKLIIREAMQAANGLLLLTLDLCGSPEELDRKLGRLCWIGSALIQKGFAFEIRVWCGNGALIFRIENDSQMKAVLDQILRLPGANEPGIYKQEIAASWHFHIGGEADEA